MLQLNTEREKATITGLLVSRMVLRPSQTDSGIVTRNRDRGA